MEIRTLGNQAIFRFNEFDMEGNVTGSGEWLNLELESEKALDNFLGEFDNDFCDYGKWNIYIQLALNNGRISKFTENIELVRKIYKKKLNGAPFIKEYGELQSIKDIGQIIDDRKGMAINICERYGFTPPYWHALNFIESDLTDLSKIRNIISGLSFNALFFYMVIIKEKVFTLELAMAELNQKQFTEQKGFVAENVLIELMEAGLLSSGNDIPFIEIIKRMRVKEMQPIVMALGGDKYAKRIDNEKALMQFHESNPKQLRAMVSEIIEQDMLICFVEKEDLSWQEFLECKALGQLTAELIKSFCYTKSIIKSEASEEDIEYLQDVSIYTEKNVTNFRKYKVYGKGNNKSLISMVKSLF